MRAPVNVVCLGECMIELREESPGRLAQGYAGDTYNTAVYLKRLDTRHALDVQYATAIGGDAFADDMVAAWRTEEVGSALVRRVPERSTGLYAIRTDAAGERHFSYWRDTSAARAYFDAAVTPLEDRADEIDLLVLSGITLAVMRGALDARLPALLDRVRARGGRVAFDNNYRARLWPDAARARAAFAMVLARTDIALLTFDDALAIDPSLEPDARWRKPSPSRARRSWSSAGSNPRSCGSAAMRRLPKRRWNRSSTPWTRPRPATRSTPATSCDAWPAMSRSPPRRSATAWRTSSCATPARSSRARHWHRSSPTVTARRRAKVVARLPRRCSWPAARKATPNS